jgi:hypothetical protein
MRNTTPVIIFVFFLAATFTLMPFCSAATTGWVKTYGGPEDDFASCLIQTRDGGFAMAGAQYANKAYSWGAYCSYWLVKTDGSGTMQWNKTYDFTSDNTKGGVTNPIETLIQTNDGGYAIAGYTQANGAANYTFNLLKIDSDGNLQWNNTYGETWLTEGFAVLQTKDNNYLIALNQFNPTSNSGNKISLILTDSEGNMQWNKTVSLSSLNQICQVIQTNDNGYAIGGTQIASYTDGSTSGSSEDFSLTKIDPSGALQWSYTYGSHNQDNEKTLTQTQDGGYALFGRTMDNSSNTNFLLIKVSSEGDMNWFKTYSGDNGEWAGSGIQTSDGGFVMFGFGRGGQGLLTKTDTTGQVEWNKEYDNFASDTNSIVQVLQTSDNGYVMASTIGESGSDNGHDFLLAKVDSVGTVPELPMLGVATIVLASTVATVIVWKSIKPKKERFAARYASGNYEGVIDSFQLW